MCQACGFYNGRLVIDMKAKAAKRDERMTAKKEARAGQATADAEQEVEEGAAEALPEAEKEEATEEKKD